jgi:hypothetical protein
VADRVGVVIREGDGGGVLILLAALTHISLSLPPCPRSSRTPARVRHQEQRSSWPRRTPGRSTSSRHVAQGGMSETQMGTTAEALGPPHPPFPRPRTGVCHPAPRRVAGAQESFEAPVGHAAQARAAGSAAALIFGSSFSALPPTGSCLPAAGAGPLRRQRQPLENLV